MDLFLIALFVIVISHSAIVYKTSSNDYLSKKTTDSVRGFFTVLVLFRHYGQYINLGQFDVLYNVLDPHIGQAIVVPFLFYSGYGVAMSYKKNGATYLKKIITKRIPKTILNFESAIVCFLTLGILQGKIFPVKQVLLSLLAWDSVGNSNWYVLVIIVEYAIFAISFSFIGDNCSNKLLLFISFACMFYLSFVLVVFLKQSGKDFYWYNTVFMFPFGAFWAYFRHYFDSYLIEKERVWLGTGILMLIIYKYSYGFRSDNVKWYAIWCVSFMALCILITIKVRFNSAIFDFCGKHVFSIYILQRIPMTLLNQCGWTKNSPYVSLMIVIYSTALLAILFDKGVGKIENRLFLSS